MDQQTAIEDFCFKLETFPSFPLLPLPSFPSPRRVSTTPACVSVVCCRVLRCGVALRCMVYSVQFQWYMLFVLQCSLSVLAFIDFWPYKFVPQWLCVVLSVQVWCCVAACSWCFNEFYASLGIMLCCGAFLSVAWCVMCFLGVVNYFCCVSLVF